MTDLLAGLVTPEDDSPPPKRAPRTRERKTSAGSGRAKKPPTPPNRVDPGWIHNVVAAAMLRALSERKFDVGTVDEDFLRQVPGMEDGPEPAALLARVIAHVAHRIPGIRRIEKRLEGNETRAGFASDAFALALQLYFRNRDIITAGIVQYRQTRDAERTAKADAAKSAPVGGFPS